MRIALAGNPNSGKTTMFNALTGSNEKVGNWAGVTVDKKERNIKRAIYKNCGYKDAIIAVDLPGAYSMSPFTSEESVTSEYIQNESVDVIINIVDATNLSRSLFFTTQLLELGIPVVVALNKADVNKKKKTVIDTAKLSARLGCPVVDTVSKSAEGMSEVIRACLAQRGKWQTAPYIDGNADMSNAEAAKLADKKRFDFVNSIVKEVEVRRIRTRDRNVQDKIDAFLTNKWLGIPIFAVVMFLVFQISQVWVGTPVADLMSIPLGDFQEWVREMLAGANPLLSALLVDGVIGGAIAVIGFLPLVMVMYFLIALLEDCGYLARASVVLDPIFKKVGLSGKSVIPFVITTGCAVPGVMACRTIKNERERRATAMLAPFMPCGAKIPVIALIAGAFFDNAGWVSTFMYFSGIVIILIGALLINKITGNSARRSYFIIELPEYKLPSLWGAFKSMCSRGWSYIVKAATIILLCNTAVHIMQSFNWSFTAVAEGEAGTSILASIAQPFAYLLLPIVGVISWQLAAAAITGFIAKENVVGTLAVCFVLSTDMMESAGPEVGAAIGITKAAALAYLMFNLFSPPCFAAIGAMSSEMKSAKWFWAGIGLQLGVGYTISFFVYQIGTLITTGELGEAALAGLIAVLLMIGFIIFLCIRGDMKARAEKARRIKR